MIVLQPGPIAAIAMPVAHTTDLLECVGELIS
jgi:hypothetical protein